MRRHLLLLLACAACTAIDRPSHRAGRFELWVLGNVQDGGLPHLGCQRACCTRARREGRAHYPACLGIHDHESGKLVLVEATPAVEAQLAALYAATGQRRGKATPVDAVLITHAHIGHYLGLAQFGREVASSKRLPVHVSPRLATFLAENGPWMQLVELGEIELRRFQANTPFEPIPGLEVTALPVPHRDEFSDTVAFKIRGSHATVLFVPDIDSWNEEPGIVERLLDGVDYAYLDGSFYDGRELGDRNIDEIPHPPIVRTMELLGTRAQAAPGELRFIHLNHTNPALSDPAIRRRIEARGFRVAQQGEHLRF